LRSWQRIASACTEGNKCQETLEKNREVEGHLGQAAVLESKPQHTFPASHSHHPLVTTALSYSLEKSREMATMASSQRALKITSAGGPPQVFPAQFGTGTGLKTVQY